MRRPETALQIALVTHLRARLPKPWLLFHVRNQGEQKTKRMHGVLKAMGVLAGVPDLFLIGPRKVIAMEVKAPRKRLRSGALSEAKPDVSQAQQDVIEALGACGIETLIVRDMDEAVTALLRMGVPLKGRAL